MKIFISYSTDDAELVRNISNYVRPHAEVYYWAESKMPGQDAWQSIFNWIDQSDLVLAVITDKTVSRAMSVGQEIGRAKAKDKTIVPLVGPNVDNSQLGCLQGVTYQRIDPDNPKPALQSIERVALAKKQQLEAKQTLFIIGGIFLLLFAMSSEG